MPQCLLPTNPNFSSDCQGMGSALSAAPDEIDIETFAKIAGDRFDRNFFYAYKDPATGNISKSKLQEFAILTDVYFSFCWGRDEDGEKIQEKLGLAASYLTKHGLICRCDNDLHSYQCGYETVRERIDNSQIFVACITQKYINRVLQADEIRPNKNSYEFNHAKNTKSLKAIILLVMDMSVLHLTSWTDLVDNEESKSMTILDYVGDDNVNVKYEMLLTNIRKLATPLRFYSFYEQVHEISRTSRSAVLQKLNASLLTEALYSDSYAEAAASAAIADVFNEPPTYVSAKDNVGCKRDSSSTEGRISTTKNEVGNVTNSCRNTSRQRSLKKEEVSPLKQNIRHTLPQDSASTFFVQKARSTQYPLPYFTGRNLKNI